MDRHQYIEEIQPLLIEDPTKVINWMKNVNWQNFFMYETINVHV